MRLAAASCAIALISSPARCRPLPPRASQGCSRRKIRPVSDPRCPSEQQKTVQPLALASRRAANPSAEPLRVSGSVDLRPRPRRLAEARSDKRGCSGSSCNLAMSSPPGKGVVGTGHAGQLATIRTAGSDRRPSRRADRGRCRSRRRTGRAAAAAELLAQRRFALPRRGRTASAGGSTGRRGGGDQRGRKRRRATKWRLARLNPAGSPGVRASLRYRTPINGIVTVRSARSRRARCMDTATRDAITVADLSVPCWCWRRVPGGGGVCQGRRSTIVAVLTPDVRQRPPRLGPAAWRRWARQLDAAGAHPARPHP